MQSADQAHLSLEDFKPAVALSAAETDRLERFAERYCGERDIFPLMREIRRAYKRADRKRSYVIEDFTTAADRAAMRIQCGVRIDGFLDHGMILGLRGARQGVSTDH